MQLKTIGWTLGLAVALAVIFSLSEGGPGRRTDAPEPAGRPGPRSAAEREEQSRYLHRYAERKFAPLLALLATTLPPDRAQRLGEILAERELAFANARDDAARTGVTFDTHCAGVTARVEREIATELGDDVAGRVRDYLRTLPQRVAVASIEHVLIYRGSAMTVEQMERLTALLNRRDVRAPQRRPSTEEWERYVAEKEAAAARAAGEAAEFLSPPQLAAVRQELDLQVGLLRVQGRSFTPAVRGAVDAGRETTLDPAAAGRGSP